MKKIIFSLMLTLVLPLNVFAGAKLASPNKIVATKDNKNYIFEMGKAKEKNLNIEIDVLNNGKWTSESKKSIIKQVNSNSTKNSVILSQNELDNIIAANNGYAFRLRYISKNGDVSDFTNEIHLGESALFKNCSSWALKDINKAKDLNIVVNSMATNMKSNITREELAEVAVKTYKYLNKRTSQGTINYFEDTNNKYVNIAVDLGLMNGNGTGTFNPKGSVTRQDFAVVISKVFGSDKVKDIKIKDKKSISNYALDAVKNSVNKKFMNLDKNSNFNPKKEMKREEVLSSIVRNIKK
ncbi:hypothetical protein ABID14_001146 [Peptoniphilus olsenii]|uniref:SLH domain-containing protein n=1 Tax=Peptoniphilus olsenii TaxID=411570 RepID=A0ABV2J9P9_9FIRM